MAANGAGVLTLMNAAVCIRGHAADYDQWSQAGNQGWSYEGVLASTKAENFNGDGDLEYHGTEGPLSVTKSNRTDDPLLDVFVVQAQQVSRSPTISMANSRRGFPATSIPAEGTVAR